MSYYSLHKFLKCVITFNWSYLAITCLTQRYWTKTLMSLPVCHNLAASKLTIVLHNLAIYGYIMANLVKPLHNSAKLMYTCILSNLYTWRLSQLHIFKLVCILSFSRTLRIKLIISGDWLAELSNDSELVLRHILANLLLKVS